MNFSVSWNLKSKKFLRKLPKEISKRIVLKVKFIRNDPFYYLEHYEGDDFYKLRVGDYRLLIDVDHSNKILKVQVVGHRKDIYQHN
jgi:mRNA interferase RelE/StbE